MDGLGGIPPQYRMVMATRLVNRQTRDAHLLCGRRSWRLSAQQAYLTPFAELLHQPSSALGNPMAYHPMPTGLPLDLLWTCRGGFSGTLDTVHGRVGASRRTGGQLGRSSCLPLPAWRAHTRRPGPLNSLKCGHFSAWLHCLGRWNGLSACISGFPTPLQRIRPLAGSAWPPTEIPSSCPQYARFLPPHSHRPLETTKVPHVLDSSMHQSHFVPFIAIECEMRGH